MKTIMQVGLCKKFQKDADYSKMNCCTNDLLIIVGLPNLRRIRTAEEQSVKWSKVIINKMELQSVTRQLGSLCFIDLCTSKHCKMVHKAEWIKTYFPKKFENPLVLLLKNLIQWLDKTAWVLTSHKLPPPVPKICTLCALLTTKCSTHDNFFESSEMVSGRHGNIGNFQCASTSQWLPPSSSANLCRGFIRGRDLKIVWLLWPTPSWSHLQLPGVLLW